jgi:hypothetical protein
MRKFTAMALISIVALVALGGGLLRDNAQAQTPGPTGLERALAAQEAHTDALMAKAGVVGTALGLDDSGNAVVEVFTTHPGVAGIPNTLDGVPVQVQVTGEFVARSGPTPIGSSSSNVNSYDMPYCFTGTLGARLTNGSKLYALSNNHVFANINGLNGSTPGSDGYDYHRYSVSLRPAQVRWQ